MIEIKVDIDCREGGLFARYGHNSIQDQFQEVKMADEKNTSS
jgi:hypothetical protein